jgi:RHS repeat-associated protein
MKKIVLSLLLGFSVLPASTQVQTGLYANGSFDNVGFDTIDRGSLNVHFTIPVVNKQGRGLGFQYQIAYDSLIWSPQSFTGTQTWAATNWGFSGLLNGETYGGYISFSTTIVRCTESGNTYNSPDYTNYVYHDSLGGAHPFTWADNTCTGVITPGGISPDGSGYSFSGDAVTARDGRILNVPFVDESTSGSVTDSNGNYISINGDGTFTDTLGTKVLTITGNGTPSSPQVFTYNTLTGTATATLNYTAYTVHTQFLCSNLSDFNLPENLVSSIVLADGSTYTFTYEATPGYPTQVTGRIASVTLPQGGTITYSYSGANGGINCADGSTRGLTRSGGAGRTYSRSSITATSSQTNVTDGLNDSSNYSFVSAGSPETFYETSRTVNQGSSSLLLSRQTCYNGTANPCTTTVVGQPVLQVDTYETLNGVQQHGSKFTYNTSGLLTSETDYDFGGATSRGGVLRNETWSYPSSGIADLLSSDTVTDGNTLIGLTNYAYDETSGTGHAALVATSVPNHAATTAQRGNLTTVTQYYTPQSSLSSEMAYEDTGNVLNSTGPTGTSTYAYDAPTHGFTITATPPTPSSGVSLPASATYNVNSGLPLTAVDANLQTTSYKSYDPRGRPTEIDFPDGGKTIASYSPNGFGFLNYMTSGQAANTETSQDAYGRANWVAVQYGSGGYYWNNYCYDGNGNLQYAAYRFAAPNQNNLSCSGAGDSYTYDALGRVLTVTHADGSNVSYTYTGRATQVTDENGISRIVQVDGLGRTTYACEVSGTTLLGVAPVNCGLDIAATGFLTTYVYNTDYSRANAQEITATQGAQTRYFETDLLGRTTLVVEPESGVTTYSYAYSGSTGLGLTVQRTRPEENQPVGSTNTVTTTTQYDSVGRVVSIGYNDGFTPSKAFYYDTNAYWAQTGTNLKGRLAVTGTSGTTTWTGSLFSYDVMGRVINLWQCGPVTCGTSNQAARPLSFTYDWAGNLTGESDTVSGAIAYTRSVAGEVTSITNQTYQNLPQNPPNLVSNVVNGPDGPVSYKLGNGLNVYQGYDTLGRLNGRWVCNGPATMYCSGGTQIYGSSVTWKGTRELSSSDTILNQQVTFGYDGFNRLTSRTVTQGTLQNYTYGYDRYGNRVSQTPLQTGYTFDPTINAANNRITTSGYTYDAAGNMLNDTVHSYSYDAEGNVRWVDGGSTAQYVYDAFNRRIHVQTASATTEFTYDYAGRRVSSWYSSANTGNEGRVYWDGQMVAFRSYEGLTYFDHEDPLGTERIRTNYAGSTASTYQSLPWGDGYSSTVNNAGGDQDNLHFAGLERDAESGTEHAQFRNYASVQGRWLGPDPYMGSYDLTNPQSLNRYAYVLNNPLSFTDPSGLTVNCSMTQDGLQCVDNGGLSDNDCSSDYTVCVAPGMDCVAYGTEGCITADNPGSQSTTPGLGSRNYSSVGFFAPNNPVPAHGWWHYGNYCGPGGAGTPGNPTGSACQAHDTCYTQGGFSPGSNLQGPNAQLQSCNQKLCDAVRARKSALLGPVAASPLRTSRGISPASVLSPADYNELQAADDINFFFTWATAPFGSSCHQ